MTAPSLANLGRRERQIMEVLYRLGSASVGDVRRELPDPPTYSSVRGMLRLLESKGLLRHAPVGLQYVYTPIVPPEKARASALRNLVRTFFGGSVRDAATALLDLPDERGNPGELERLRRLVSTRRPTRKGRK
jgi:BlaI family penicillinase repressor